MSFHLGKPVAVLIALAIITGVIALLRPSPKRADVVVWVFADTHAQTYRSTRVIDREKFKPFLPAIAGGGTLLDLPMRQTYLTQLFQQRTGYSVDVQLINYNALNIRLNALFDRGAWSPELPDVVEVEIGTVGRYFRPPVDLIGFLPLEGYLEKSPWKNSLVAARKLTWSKGGHLYGIPHDLHPVTITYRADRFEQAGVDLKLVKTWPEFHEACLKYRDYWRAQNGGVDKCFAMELSRNSSDLLVMMLMQQHISLVDSAGISHLTDPKVAKTIAFFAQMVAGPKNIAGNSNPGPQQWANDFATGYLGGIITADWRAGFMPNYAPQAAGTAKMIALPRFDIEHDAPTASWGGTMIGIPRYCKDPDRAWKLIELLYLSDEGLQARKETAKILPPVIEAWNDPTWHQPMPYFSGEREGELYIELAKQMPPIEVSPYRSMAQQLVTFVLSRACDEVDAGHLDGLEGKISGWLKEADADLQKRMAFQKFDE